LLDRCQALGLDRPLPISDEENVAQQGLCPNSLIGDLPAPSTLACHHASTSMDALASVL
jgi:hypothetical protein